MRNSRLLQYRELLNAKRIVKGKGKGGNLLVLRKIYMQNRFNRKFYCTLKVLSILLILYCFSPLSLLIEVKFQLVKFISKSQLITYCKLVPKSSYWQ